VEAALESIQLHVNVATGLAHPADKTFARDTIRTLNDAGHRIDADGVRKWALRNGWNHRGATDLAGLAKKYQV
jgi:hypothetical protein